MSPIQFGFTIPAELRNQMQQDNYIRNVNHALTLATGHFDSAWIVDHLQFGDTTVLESFTTLSYLVALYPDLKFGHAVICQSFRNPALLAKMAATLQFLTGGRYILGIGAGWHEEEYRAYGYDFPPSGARVAQLEEAIQIIRSLWTQERTTFKGQYYQVKDAVCQPHPDPIPPLMIGAFKPKMLRLAATYADWWNVSSTGIAPYQRMVGEVERVCEEIGRDPTSLRRSWIGGCVCRSAEKAARRVAAEQWNDDDDDDFSFVGTPQQIIEQMGPFIETGVDYFMLDCSGFPDLTTLELLTSEVLPAFKSSNPFKKPSPAPLS